MRRAAGLLFLLLLVAISFSKSPSGTAHQGIQIEGPRSFQENVKRALRLIESESPEQYADVCRLVKSIRLTRSRPAPDVAAYCDHNQRIYIVGEYYVQWIEQTRAHPMAFSLIPALIVHESVHLQQIRDGRDTTSETAEMEALQAERLLRARLSGSFLE